MDGATEDDPGAQEPAVGAVEQVRALGVERGGVVALALAPAGGAALAGPDGSRAWPEEEAPEVLRAVEAELQPRWVWWSSDTALALDPIVRVARCWDIAAVQRLLSGGWRADPARVWARVHDLPLGSLPSEGPVDLFTVADPDAGDEAEPVRPDGHLRVDWAAGGWARPDRLARWAELAAEVQVRQAARLDALSDRPVAPATARAECAAELLCVELTREGLPMDRAVAEGLVAGFVGPRPRTGAEAAELRRRRDDEVLRHAPDDVAGFDLRSPAQVKSLLRRVGIEVPDTRAWRLEGLRDAHPIVEPLLAWRKAERIGTTYGYGWLDEHLGVDGRLRGSWTAADGAAGRMTASAGLHNMPADLRAAVVAEPGHVFVRADLGQIEPRVLAAVSGDRALARAAREDDMYARVARQLGVERPTAKVAMLGAMYGQTTGLGARALRDLRTAYPVALTYLEDADRAGQAGRDLRTHGGRRIRLGSPPGLDAGSARDQRSRAAARGRYARNALVQGGAAELFKVWAVIVRARGRALGARVVLCLHDELLVHVPTDEAEAVVRLLDDALQEAAPRWAPGTDVRFVADVTTVRCWADAKG